MGVIDSGKGVVDENCVTKAVSNIDVKNGCSVNSPDGVGVKESEQLNGQGETTWIPSVGSVCCAKWSDRVWYNARVDKILKGGKEVYVTFTDYGNTDKVPIRKLVEKREMI